ncbi:MAG: hypothetical protein HY721_05555 [Planctomycetes bacterium]|nr:hypothetical protein [Planctomycetota bacterium]
MRSTSAYLKPLAAVPFLLSAALATAGEGAGSKLESLQLGDPWYGPKLALEDLKGRVVLLEFWGHR